MAPILGPGHGECALPELRPSHVRVRPWLGGSQTPGSAPISLDSVTGFRCPDRLLSDLLQCEVRTTGWHRARSFICRRIGVVRYTTPSGLYRPRYLDRDPSV